ncbi:MlaD family protein [Nocardia sp. CA-136227]|uniref:MlaD family protein n=1 Tax=Nocardia sp. CA-136227 TaxID=3239979 RepID=UPI003D99E19F
MKSVPSLLLRLAACTAAMGLLLYGVLQALDRPVAGGTTTYSAVFTDANGLRAGNDVRLFGVRVGKVSSLALDGTKAKVVFTLDRDRTIYGNTTLAIRYQSLTGARYLDIQQAEQPGQRVDPARIIGVEHTVPAFDVTTLFNGLQPVLAELSPADLNQFATGMLGVIEGNGTGLGPALGAIETLSRYTTDRQAVISLLVRNLAVIAERIGGSSGNAMTMLSRLTDLFATLQERVGGLIDFSLTIPPVLVPARSLLRTVGLTGDPNADLNRLVKNAFPDTGQALDVLGRLPGLLQSLSALIPASGSEVNRACGHGAAPAPAPLQVLISGQRIALCNN